MPRIDEAETTHRLEHLVHWTLLCGLLASAALLCFGLVLARGQNQDAAAGPPPAVSRLVARAWEGSGSGLLDLGLLVLMATPVLRVAVLAAGWLAAKEWRFGLVAVVVLALLILSMSLGVG